MRRASNNSLESERKNRVDLHGKIHSTGKSAMIRSIHIRNYRAFSRFDIENLSCINLLVGSNNSGKTSILEAVHLLVSRGDPASLWQILSRRGERISSSIEVDISHLFHGHEFRIGSSFSLSAKNQFPERKVEFSIAELSESEQGDILGQQIEDEAILQPKLALTIKGRPSPPVPRMILSRVGGLSSDVLSRQAALGRRRAQDDIQPVQFITTDSSTADELFGLWDNISLRPEETLVLRALQSLDPNIEQIRAHASPASGRYLSSARTRGGFIVKLKGYELPIPIGSMGDGMWRILAMAIAISQCKGGVLLIDEIDSGLHYTVMSAMWTLIHQAARDFDVQVFATTHSLDCVNSLSALCVAHGTEISLQRIESGKSSAVLYTEEELRAASERGIEVR